MDPKHFFRKIGFVVMCQSHNTCRASAHNCARVPKMSHMENVASDDRNKDSCSTVRFTGTIVPLHGTDMSQYSVANRRRAFAFVETHRVLVACHCGDAVCIYFCKYFRKMGLQLSLTLAIYLAKIVP